MKKNLKTKLHIIGFLIAVLLSARVFSLRVLAVPPVITAESAYMVDADTGIVLFAQNEHERQYPASTTKLMTVLLALEHAKGDFKQEVKFTWSAIGGLAGTSHLAMLPDEVISLEDALYAVLLHSANDVSNAVAEHVGGTLEDFALMMTARAAELGCQNTNFKNAHGLHHEEHYTTAYDMARIMRELIKHPDFIRFSSTFYHAIPPTDLQPEQRPFNNSNRLINRNSEYYNPLILCGKTGYTDQARHTLVTLAQKDGGRIITAVMKTPQYGIFTDTTALVDYGFSLYDYVTVFDTADFTPEAHTVNTLSGEFEITVGGDAGTSVVRYLPAFFDSTRVEQRTVLLDLTDTQIAQGDRAGHIALYYEDGFLGSVLLYAGEPVPVPAPLTEQDAPLEETQDPENAGRFAGIIEIITQPVLYISAAAALAAAAVFIRKRRRRTVSRFDYVQMPPTRE